MNQLLASPLFHQMVRKVHRKVNHLRYGAPPEEMGGTKIDVNCKPIVVVFHYTSARISMLILGSMSPAGPGYFLRLFKEEIKQQLKDNPSKRG
jgi:hypothetical protein